MSSMSDFSTLTGLTSFNIGLDICLYARPPIVACNQFLSLIPPWMSCSDGIMIYPNDLFSKLFTARNVKPMFPCYQIVFVIPSSFFVGKSFDYCRILAIVKLFNLGDNVVV